MSGRDDGSRVAPPLFPDARWQQLRPLFDALCEASAETRAAELARIEIADAALADSLRRLLGDEGGAVAADPGALLDVDAAMPVRIGPFGLVSSLGAGGMGTVYLAEREGADFIQRVAIKLLDGGSSRLAHFAARERRVLAALAHPHITAFVDAGTQDGRAWLAMEYVPGQTLLSHCDERRLGLRERVALFDQVCSAVAHAHAHLVVHRDLKPSNILVGTDGRAKLLDFGIALVLDDVDPQTPATRVFTPEYAAPEQMRGERVTTASDVYSLGLILYELIAGQRLSASERFDREREWSAAELARAAGSASSVRDDGARTAVETAQISAALRGDLGRIIACALDPSPARRYASVASLREDLARWRDDRPLSIGRPGRGYVLRRFVRRHRVGVSIAAVGMVAILTLAATALWQARAKAQQAENARIALRQSEATRDFINSIFLSADPYSGKGAQTTAGELLAAARARIDRDLAREPDIAAALLLQIGHVYASLYDREDTIAAMTRAVYYNERSAQPSSILEGSARARIAFETGTDRASDFALAQIADAVRLLRTTGAAGQTELARALQMQGNLQQAYGEGDGVAPTREAVELLQALGRSHASEYLGSVQVLGDLLTSLDRNAEALEWVERALAASSDPDTDTTTLRAGLEGVRAVALSGLGRHVDAEPALDRAIAASTSSFGSEHANTRYWRYRRAELLEMLGRLDEADAEMKQLIAVDASSDEHGMARMAHLVTAADIAEARRAADAANDIERAQATACGNGGHPMFCAKVRLLRAENAIRERRLTATQAGLAACAQDEAIESNPLLARWLQVLRAREHRMSGEPVAARAILEPLRRAADASADEMARIDAELGLVALAASEFEIAIMHLQRARDHLTAWQRIATPIVREIDEALEQARRNAKGA